MKIGWIGTGVMGAAMAGHLLDGGDELTVFNRTAAKAQPLLDRGAHWADSPAAVAEQSDFVFTMVAYPNDVIEVILGERGVLSGLRPGGILVDCTTSSPALAVEIAMAAKAKGVASFDAPVSGGDIGAREATLSIMVGGDKLDYIQVLPLLERMGRNVIYQGPAGSGQHAKMVNQILVATGMIAVCEGLIYARASGLEPETVLESVGCGAAASWALTNYGPRMLKGDLAPGFRVEHFIKDMKIALDEAERMNLSLPGLALAKQLYTMVAAMGGAGDGTQALIKAMEAMSFMSGPGELSGSGERPRGALVSDEMLGD